MFGVIPLRCKDAMLLVILVQVVAPEILAVSSPAYPAPDLTKAGVPAFGACVVALLTSQRTWGAFCATQMRQPERGCMRAQRLQTGAALPGSLAQGASSGAAAGGAS